jgi:hypothetical protein
VRVDEVTRRQPDPGRNPRQGGLSGNPGACGRAAPATVEAPLSILQIPPRVARLVAGYPTLTGTIIVRHDSKVLVTIRVRAGIVVEVTPRDDD